MKPNQIVLIAFTAYFLANAALSFAGVDMQKWESFVKSELQGVVQQVDKTGKAPVTRPLVADYDTNKDNFIDATEVKAIKAYLGNSPQVETPAVQEPVAEKAVPAVKKTQPVKNYQTSASKGTKKKEWWNN